MLEFLLFFSGFALGAVLVFFLFNKKQSQFIEQSSSLKANNKNLNKELESQKKLYEEKFQEKEKNFKQLTERAEKELENQKKHFKELDEKVSIAFKQVAKEIFLENTKSYREESTKNLSQILKPFQENIEGFKKSIQSFEGREKFLDETIKHFTDINSKMGDNTIKLTQALQGDIRSQGQWGEFVLANILEKSGLRKGEEFFLQSQGLGVKDEKGSSIRPDVTVKLPDNKHIVIDSKVSFIHYNEYISSNTEEERQKSLTKILNSMSLHIDRLSSKKYQFSESLDTPDFTLMFIPNEGIFALATQTKKDLFDKAWKQSIVIVSPTTLYATLRTIASLWKIEKQNKNAEEIAKQGGLLYDKFVGFLEDMSRIDNSLKTARISYDEAIGKLRDGKGNLVKRIQKLKTLGARTQKEIPADFNSE